MTLISEGTSQLLQSLNPTQAQAVLQTRGPCLIVAGPGSGKTRVITHRIAHIIHDLHEHPKNVIAVTFTNRAAKEMLDRTQTLIGHGSELPEVRTFHSLCAKYLKMEGEHIGLPSDFTIYDDDDQVALIRQCLRYLNIQDARPSEWLDRISKAKSHLLGPAESARNLDSPKHAQTLRQVYQLYQTELIRAHAVDFDDLIMLTVNMIRNSEEVRHRLQSNHKFFMVDEFQDTNPAQYALCKLLSERHRNICVVGDPDQSIYAWRSAEPENLQHFLNDHPDARTIALGENYRSTAAIVEASHKLIVNNPRPIPNPLFTENDEGLEIAFETFHDEADEAETIINEIRLMTDENLYTPGDCAVLYRTNASSRPVEEACINAGMKYRVIGATSFYRRKEVRDTLAYVKLLVNRHDQVSMMRIINTPPRGLGQKAIAALDEHARESGQPIYSYMELVAKRLARPKGMSNRAVDSITDFINMMELMRKAAGEMPCDDLIRTITRETGLDTFIRNASDTANDRWANIQTMIATAGRNYSGPASQNLEDFLEQAALMEQEDNNDPDADALTLITLHKAKGTEYPVVFIIGMEEGTLPHRRSMTATRELQEERRLCYVGMTRAKERLYLSRTNRTRSFRTHEEGRSNQRAQASRFLDEIFPEPDEHGE